MLVLTRKEGEKVELENADQNNPLVIPPGGRIGTVEVTQAVPGKTRLGWDFPSTVRIRRAELENKPKIVTTGLPEAQPTSTVVQE